MSNTSGETRSCLYCKKPMTYTVETENNTLTGECVTVESWSCTNHQCITERLRLSNAPQTK